MLRSLRRLSGCSPAGQTTSNHPAGGRPSAADPATDCTQEPPTNKPPDRDAALLLWGICDVVVCAYFFKSFFLKILYLRKHCNLTVDCTLVKRFH